MKSIFISILICLLLTNEIIESNAQDCKFKKDGSPVPGKCLKVKNCLRLQSGPSPKCRGETVCCDNTFPACQGGGICTLRARCKPSHIIGKCEGTSSKSIVCCKKGPRVLPTCKNGSVCNLRVTCKRKHITGSCGSAPMSLVVCCKTSLRRV